MVQVRCLRRYRRKCLYAASILPLCPVELSLLLTIHVHHSDIYVIYTLYIYTRSVWSALEITRMGIGDGEVI